MPQRPAFNGGQWAQFEKRIRKYAGTCTKDLKGELYLLTGTSFAHYHPGDPAVITHPVVNSLFDNVNGGSIFIPNSMWTAGCCVAEGNTQNFAVIGNNVDDPDEMHTQQINIEELEKILLADVKYRRIGGQDPVFLFPGNMLCSDRERDVTLP